VDVVVVAVDFDVDVDVARLTRASRERIIKLIRELFPQVKQVTQC